MDAFVTTISVTQWLNSQGVEVEFFRPVRGIVKKRW